MKKIILLVSVFVFAINLSVAQSTRTEKADKLYNQFQFTSAIKAYNKLVDKGEATAYVLGRIAEANYNMNNTIDAETYFQKALSLKDNAEMRYKYAQMLKANGKFDASNKEMARFANDRPDDYRSIAFKKNPKYINKIREKGDLFTIRNLEINSEKSDFGGLLKGDDLYISSSRNKGKRVYSWNKEPYLDIYKFTKNEDGKYNKGTLLGSTINSKYHEGIVSLTPDGNTMYFDSESFVNNVYDKDEKTEIKYSVIHLYKSVKLGNDWGEAVSLKINKTGYSVKHPSISADGTMIYFSSDMPGGYGGFDIYKAAIQPNGELGKAINLGRTVNTESQEMFPFISKTNTLYYSSTGKLGLGGLDVFYTKDNGDGMVEARNIGLPVNSTADDFAFYYNESTGEGFVSSNRKGGKGSDDIYELKRTKDLCNTSVTAIIKNTKTGEVVKDATVVVMNEDKEVLYNKITDAKGEINYTVTCEVTTELKVILEDYEESSVLKVVPSLEEELKVEIPIIPIEKIEPPVLAVAGSDLVEVLGLKPIYFDRDKSFIRPDAEIELQKVIAAMHKYPTMRIDVRSHTDSRAPDSYNMKLSDRRAKSTIKYIIEKGNIDASRVIGKGYGESQPINHCTNGAKCSKEEFERNRRSEFIIL